MTIASPLTKVTRHPIVCKSLRNYFREYCQCSSIHGFRYFGEKRTYFERFWWFIVFNIVVAACVHSITLVYQKWNDSPVIVSFDTSEAKLDSIPFPAVTICPETKSVASEYNYTDIIVKLSSGKGNVNITEEEKTKAEYMSMNCDILPQVKNKFPTKSDILTDDFFDFLDKVRPKDIFHHCTWRNKNIKNCEDLFIPIITDEGICYTFNMLERQYIFKNDVMQYKDFLTHTKKKNSSWTIENGYEDDNVMMSYPWRANFAGVKNAFDITLRSFKEDLNPICKNGIHGFKVVLHTPMRFPLVGDQYFRIPLDEAVLGALQPAQITTSKDVVKYGIDKRQCYIMNKNEKQLKYFKTYSQLNCNLECLTNFTLYACGCVNFYMPRNKGTTICGSKKAKCMKLAENYSKNNYTRRHISDRKSECNCLPICSDLSYHIETSQGKWDWSERLKVLKPKDTLSSTNKVSLSKLSLYFKTSQFVTSRRHEFYGPTDFFANFGGIVGLFTGVSVLSIMEAIYFVTLRLFCNVRLYGRWYGPNSDR